MVTAYFNAMKLAEDPRYAPHRRIVFRNSLGTLYHFMSPQEQRIVTARLQIIHDQKKNSA